MQLGITVKEFCDYNKDNWRYHHDYTTLGDMEITINNGDMNNFKQVTLTEDKIHDIHIESNQLCIALKSKIMIWLGGDTGTFEIDSTDYFNPMFKNLEESEE